ncbi:hypothetical protein Hanom_Chr17g01539121 [Helianthus anomalus]
MFRDRNVIFAFWAQPPNGKPQIAQLFINISLQAMGTAFVSAFQCDHHERWFIFTTY